ncbi:hypothetical protein Dimus_029218, partial [Dionaea muscipula]
MYHEYNVRGKTTGCDAAKCGCVMRSAFGLLCAHEMCAMSQHRRPVDLADVHVFWKTLTVGDEEGVHRVHEDSEMPNALRLIDESLEVIKKANPDQQMFYAHAIHSLIHPESIEVEEPITRQHKGLSLGVYNLAIVIPQ